MSVYKLGKCVSAYRDSIYKIVVMFYLPGDSRNNGIEPPSFTKYYRFSVNEYYRFVVSSSRRIMYMNNSEAIHSLLDSKTMDMICL